MEDIVMIVNSDDMKNIAMEIIESSGDNIRIVSTHTYEESLELGKRLEDEGCRLLIARGGHAKCLRNSNLSIPVIDIPFTGNDITSILIRAKREWGEFAVVGNRMLVQMSKELEHAIEAVIHYCTIDNWSDFKAQMVHIRDMGVRTVVGGYDACRFAEELGLVTYCVTTNQYEISTAISNAKRILETMDQTKHWNDLFRTVLDTIREGLLIVDRDGVITHINQTAKRMLSGSENVEVGEEIRNVLFKERISNALSNGTCVYDELTEADDYKYTSTIVPLSTGESISEAVIVLQEVAYARKIEHKVRYQQAQKGFVANKRFEDILGESSITCETINKAKQYALVNSTVLIIGETGTGKEMFAQSIHNYSQRKDEAFVAVNCATIPANLLESELFGYTEGAFTGAKRGGKTGLFELAHNGTIFLDEIGETSLSMQARLLRVLEERQIMRIGDDHVIPVNIRVIAATNKDLKQLVEKEKFRQDFYYRLNVLTLNLQPLHNRKKDVIALAEHYVKKYAEEHGKKPAVIKDEAMDVFLQYPWPGNARELKNIIERIIVTNTSGVLGLNEAREALGIPASSHAEGNDPEGDKQDARKLIDQREYDLIREVLRKANGNKSRAAELLGISRPTLHRKLKQMGEE